MADPFPLRATLRHVLPKAVLVVILAELLHASVEHFPIGEHLRSFEYAIFQTALRSSSRPLRQRDRHLLPVVIDISNVPFDRSQPTDRDMLDELISELKGMNAAAIGVDIDFSPDDQGEFITPRDPQFFDRWTRLGNVRVGVYRREGDSPAHWLGNAAFKDLAAGIMLPEEDATYAYQFSSPDLSSWPTLGSDSYLLQMPSALQRITHPRDDRLIVDDPNIKRTVKEERIKVGMYPIDFSFRDALQPIPYRHKGDLTQWSDYIDGRVVLVGDTRDREDSRSIPGLSDPISGVLIHAAALTTLNEGLLWYVDKRSSDIFKFALLFGVILVMLGAHYVRASAPRLRHLDEYRVEMLASWCAAAFTLTASSVFVRLTRIFWPDFLMITAGFLLHPYISMVCEIAFKGAKGFVLSTTRT